MDESIVEPGDGANAAEQAVRFSTRLSTGNTCWRTTAFGYVSRDLD